MNMDKYTQFDEKVKKILTKNESFRNITLTAARLKKIFYIVQIILK